MPTLRKLIKPFLIISGTLLLLLVTANVVVLKSSEPYLYDQVPPVPACYTAIVLGAKVASDGTPSAYLQDRLDMAYELYRNGKISRFLLSGDHGRENYDEVNHMKAYLIGRGVRTEDIFLDHAGFDTYNTMVRARRIFEVKDAIIVTQEFHLPRSVYIARSQGIKAYGIKADHSAYRSTTYLQFRELSARVKAFAEVVLHKDPKFLGEPIPITGDSKLSYD